LLVLLLSGALISPAGAEKLKETRITLERLGYPSDIRLEGSNPAVVFYVPLPAGVNLRKSYLELHLLFSSVLDKTSSVKVMLNDSPAFTALVKDLTGAGEQAAVRVPLEKIKVNSFPTTLKIEVRTHLFITRNICEDLATGNLWAVVKNDSFVALSSVGNDIPATIAGFLDGSFDQVQLILPQTVTVDVAAAYIKVFSFLQRVFRERGITLNTYLSSQLTDISVGESIRKIYFEEKGPQIFLDGQGALHISAGSEDAFISSWRQLLLAPAVKTGSIEKTGQEITRLTFEELGYGPVVLRGIGDLKASYTFAVSDLGGPPAALKLVLFGEYTPLKNSDKDKIYLKVYLNGLLLKALVLPEQGKVSGLSVEIPDYTLKRENTLDVVYSYYPEVSNCVAGIAPFEGLVCHHSYLEIAGHRKEELLDFQSLPGSFTGRGVIVLPDEKSPFYLESLKAAAYLFASFRQLDRVALDIAVANFNELKENGADYYLFALPPEELSNLKPVVRLTGKEMVFFNPLTGREVFKASLSEGLGVFQVFFYQGRPAAVFSFSGEDASLMPMAARFLLDPDHLRRLSGNVAFYKDGELTGLDVGKKLRVKVPGEKSLWYYYQRYKAPIYLVLWLFLALGAYLVYQRLARLKGGKNEDGGPP
jgi:hypothetical protein